MEICYWKCPKEKSDKSCQNESSTHLRYENNIFLGTWDGMGKQMNYLYIPAVCTCFSPYSKVCTLCSVRTYRSSRLRAWSLVTRVRTGSTLTVQNAGQQLLVQTPLKQTKQLNSNRSSRPNQNCTAAAVLELHKGEQIDCFNLISNVIGFILEKLSYFVITSCMGVARAGGLGFKP